MLKDCNMEPLYCHHISYIADKHRTGCAVITNNLAVYTTVSEIKELTSMIKRTIFDDVDQLIITNILTFKNE